MRLSDLIEIPVLEKLAQANFKANGMPIGIIDAVDGRVLVGFGWQDICVRYHRVNAVSAARCRESDDQIKAHLSKGEPCEYICRNGLRDIGLPIAVRGEHLATLFMGQFFYSGESPDRSFFVAQAEQLGFEPGGYLAALDRVPVFSREAVENILAYDTALAAFVSGMAESALRRREAEEEARSLAGAKDQFLAVLSHELRNPLAPIRNALWTLDHADPRGPAARRAKEIAARQLAHLTRLVDDLLDVTRVGRGRVELRRAPLELSALVGRAGEDHRALMGERGLAFELELAGEPVWVDGDETRLAQVIGNLLRNAAKFTPEGGRVTLSVARAGEAAEVRVRDTGSGIEPGLLERVFEPFVQAEQSLARTEGGLGLGLALARELVAQHGGAVTAASGGRGQGTEVTVRLPAIPPPRASAAPVAPAAQPGAARRRVLVVDDNRDAAESLAELVRMFGHDAEVALDGAGALRMVRARPPDLVLCDLGLPGMSGYEVARAVRREDRLAAVELVAVSGYAQPDDRARSLEAGFREHVAKPLDPDELRRIVGGGAGR